MFNKCLSPILIIFGLQLKYSAEIVFTASLKMLLLIFKSSQFSKNIPVKLGLHAQRIFRLDCTDFRLRDCWYKRAYFVLSDESRLFAENKTNQTYFLQCPHQGAKNSTIHTSSLFSTVSSKLSSVSSTTSFLLPPVLCLIATKS